MSTDRILGEGYTAHRIDLGADEEGPLIATLVHRVPTGAGVVGPPGAEKPPILMMHGWSDYVLRSRPHGASRAQRARRVGARPAQVRTQPAARADRHRDRSLNRYDAEIGASLRIIGRERPPILLAHSTGGLIAALWAQRSPGTVRGIALNSPWLEMHLGPVTRSLAEAPVRLLADRLRQRPILPFGSDHYARTTHRDFGGPHDYDLTLKPAAGHRLPATTLSAIIDGQRRLAAAGPLSIPVLVLHSARSRIGPRFTEEMRRADSVLDIRSLAAAAARLGPEVRIEPVEGARHDVFLSDADARSSAVAILDDWLKTPSRSRSARLCTRSHGPRPAPPCRSAGEGEGR